MDRTVDALKNLYVAQGGTATDFTAVTIPDAINLIAAVSASTEAKTNAEEEIRA